MPRKRLPYQEGDWIAVPLRNGGYALGLVGRMDGQGGIVGYFFGPRQREVPHLTDAHGLAPIDAILIRRFGDLELIRGNWPILGRLPGWDRNVWPLPSFGRIALDNSWATRVEYDETTLDFVREVPVSLEEAQQLPEDGLSGAGAVEIRLTKLLTE